MCNHQDNKNVMIVSWEPGGVIRQKTACSHSAYEVAAASALALVL